MEYRDLLPFDEFLTQLFLPALQRCERATEPELVTALISFFESLLWLELGADLRVFSRSQGQALVIQYEDSIRHHFDLYPPEYRYLVSDLFLGRVNRMLRSRELGLRQEFSQSPRLAMQFQILLKLLSNINANQSATSFSTALLLFRQPPWEDLIKDSAHIFDRSVLDAINGVRDTWLNGHRAHIYAGYFYTLTHLEALIQALDYSQRPEDVDLVSWSGFRQEVHLIHGWRLRFGDLFFRGRFTEVTEVVEEQMRRHLKTIGVESEEHGLIQYVRTLMDGWTELAQPASFGAAGAD